MQIIDALLTKLKIKELISILFLSTLILSILPVNLLESLGILEFKIKYQVYISLFLIASSSYYFYKFLYFVSDIVVGKFFGPEKIAIKYMKQDISHNEIELIAETFYNHKENIFNMTGYINYSDGRKAALEYNGIVYRAASVSKRGMYFAYNLQPYVLDYLNKKLNKGDIKVSNGQISYIF